MRAERSSYDSFFLCEKNKKTGQIERYYAGSIRLLKEEVL